MTTPSSPSPRKKSSSSDRVSRRQARAQEAVRKQRQKRLMTLLAAVLVVAIAGVTIFAIVTSQQDTKPTPAASAVAESQAPQSGMSIGVANAPVTVIEYADFQCPYCAAFALQMKPEIVQKYVDTGKVRFEFKPMPILSSKALDDPSNESVRAAEASWCAADQGKFWDYYTLLFSKQTGENVGDFTDSNLVSYAQGLGLDTTTFSTCLSNRTHLQDVMDARQAGITAGVTGTPTFFVNGEKVVGYGGLEQKIEDALNAGS